MDKYDLDQLILSPQYHSVENGSLEWFINLFPEIDPLKIKNRFNGIYKREKKRKEYEKIHWDIYQLTTQNSKRLKYIYTLSSDNKNLLKKLHDDYTARQFSAIKINGLLHNPLSNDRGLDNIINFCKTNRLPLFIYVYQKKEAEYIYDLALNHLDNIFVVASMSGLEYFEYHAHMPPNLMCELTNLKLVSEYRLLKALNIFGPQSLLFSYEAINEKNLYFAISRIMNLAIPDNIKKMILSQNSNKLFSQKK